MLDNGTFTIISASLANIVETLDRLNTNVSKLTKAVESLSDDRSKTKKEVKLIKRKR